MRKDTSMPTNEMTVATSVTATFCNTFFMTRSRQNRPRTSGTSLAPWATRNKIAPTAAIIAIGTIQ
ncbi:MAG TPA: hypothetical protein VEK73_10670 [Xanthobacteraceae bacterium]|nr:hypothetical protein [Xanthobacteraceae bacterium]